MTARNRGAPRCLILKATELAVFVAAVVISALVVVVVIGVAIFGINIVGMLACCVGYIFTIPFSNLIMAVAYLRMTRQPTIMDVGWPSANEQPTAEIQGEDHSW